MKKIICALFLLLLVSACGNDQKDKIQGTQDYAGKPFTITVYVYDSYGDLNRSIRDINNGAKVQGFSVWNLDASSLEMTDCSVHVVMPAGVTDTSELTTWGHELAHCVYGTYHPVGVR